MVNQFHLSGNVGKILKHGDGKKPFSFTCCYSRRYYKDDEWHTRNEWFNVSYFGRGKETYADKIKVGDFVEVLGEICNHQYEDADGNTRYTFYVNASYVAKPQVRKEKEEKPEQEDEDEDSLPF